MKTLEIEVNGLPLDITVDDCDYEFVKSQKMEFGGNNYSLIVASNRNSLARLIAKRKGLKLRGLCTAFANKNHFDFTRKNIIAGTRGFLTTNFRRHGSRTPMKDCKPVKPNVVCGYSKGSWLEFSVSPCDYEYLNQFTWTITRDRPFRLRNSLDPKGGRWISLIEIVCNRAKIVYTKSKRPLFKGSDPSDYTREHLSGVLE